MGPQIVRKNRVLPHQPTDRECVVPLSLLDATTAKFALTSAIWLLERPSLSLESIELGDHLRTALSVTLSAYPQWCGHLKAILAIESNSLPPETTTFPAHAKRYGRVYVHYGTSTDPGVEFVEATSSAIVDNLYSTSSAKRRPIWNRREDEEALAHFVPQTEIVQALEPNEKGADDLYKPIFAAQYTQLACGGLVLTAKIAHPLADITTLTRFVRDWASVSRAMLTGKALPVLNHIFEPQRLDAFAAGNINAHEADPSILEDALSLPLHRYDWWAPPATPPSTFPTHLPLAGKPLPWAEWDTKAPVDIYTIHFTHEQINRLWQSATRAESHTSPNLKISKHDALLAHIWSCVVRARGLTQDHAAVHCDLVLGTRPAFQFDDSFLGSPTMMLNIEMAASQVASEEALAEVSRCVRKTLSKVNITERLAAHLHSVAFEKSPQRIWQAFLGQRHILVTTWARAGVYDVDFGLGSCIRYVDGVVPGLDGCILIINSPSTDVEDSFNTTARGWIRNGIDVTLPLRCDDMERLLQDPLLLPKAE